MEFVNTNMYVEKYILVNTWMIYVMGMVFMSGQIGVCTGIHDIL